MGKIPEVHDSLFPETQEKYIGRKIPSPCPCCEASDKFTVVEVVRPPVAGAGLNNDTHKGRAKKAIYRATCDGCGLMQTFNALKPNLK